MTGRRDLQRKRRIALRARRRTAHFEWQWKVNMPRIRDQLEQNLANKASVLDLLHPINGS